MVWRVLLFLVLLVAGAGAQTEIIGPNLVRETIPREDGSYSYRFDAYFNEQFYRSGDSWRPITVDWEKLPGAWGITNGTYRITLDSATQVLRIQRGSHIWKTRLHAIGYYDPTRDSVHILATYTPGDVTRSGRTATRSAYFPGVTVQWKLSRAGLEEFVKLSAAARSAIPTPASLGLSNAQSFLVLATEVWVDSLGLDLKNSDGTVTWTAPFTTEQGLSFRNAADSVVFSMLESYAWVPDIGGDTTQRSESIPLRSRFERRNGRLFLVQGAKASTLAALPAGPIVFDPPNNFTVSTDTWMQSPTANQHDDNSSNSTWQIGWLTAPTFTAVRDTLYPTGDYVPENWTRSTGNDSWALLDEVTPNTTDYVTASTAACTTIVTFQDLAPSLDANFHVMDSCYIGINMKSSFGDNGYIALIADTTGNGIDDFFRFDSVMTTNSYATTFKRLCFERSITAFDSLKIGIVTLWDPSTSVSVSWLAAVPYWQKVATDGLACHEVITLPNALFRGNDFGTGLPVAPDSAVLWVYFDPSYQKLDNNFHIRTYGLVMGKDPDVSGQVDWVHRTHSSRAWKAKGAKWTTQFLTETATGADVYGRFAADSLDTINRIGWTYLRLPDTVVYEAWKNDLAGITPATGIVIMPDPRESGQSRRQAHSLEGTNDPYVSFYCTVRHPKLQVGGFNNGDTLPGFGQYQIDMVLKPDTSDRSLFDSAVATYKYLSDTVWRPFWNYIGPSIPFAAWGDSACLRAAADTVGSTKPNVTIWDCAPEAEVSGTGMWGNQHGLCSLSFEGYTALGNADTTRLQVFVDSSFWTLTPCVAATYVDSNVPTYNFGASTAVKVGKQRNLYFRANNILKPPTRPNTIPINVRHILRLRKKGTAAVGAMTFLSARMDSTAWVQGTKDSATAASNEPTWSSYKYGTSSWANPGGDFDADSVADTTSMGFVGTGEQYGYLNATNLARNDSINAGLKYLNGPRDVAQFYPVGTPDSMQPGVLTVWRERSAILASGEAALWTRSGGFSLPAINPQQRQEFTMSGLPGRPKIIYFFASTATTGSSTTWNPTNGTPVSVALTAERTSDGVMCVGQISLYNEAGADNASWGGIISRSNVQTPGTGEIFFAAAGGVGAVDTAWCAGYTPDGFTIRYSLGTTHNWGSYLRLWYFAIGGTDITNVACGNANINRNTTSFSNTVLTWTPAFKPDAFLTLWSPAASVSTLAGVTQRVAQSGIVLGAMDSSVTNRWFCGVNMAGSSGPDTARGVFNREWDYYEFTTVDGQAEEAVRVRPTAIASGSLTWSAAQDAQVQTGNTYASYFWVAVKGGYWCVAKADGQNVSAGTAQTISLPRLVGTPVGALFVSAGMPDTVREFQDNSGAIDGTADTMWCGGQAGWGAYDGSTQFAVMPSWGWFYKLYGQVPRVEMWSTGNRALVTFHQRPATPSSAPDESFNGTSFANQAVNITWVQQRAGTLTASDIGVLAVSPSNTPTSTSRKGRRRRATTVISEVYENEKTPPSVFVWPVPLPAGGGLADCKQ